MYTLAQWTTGSPWHWAWGPAWLFFFVLLFGFAAFIATRLAGGRCGARFVPYADGGYGQAEVILRERLARGEIDQAEYDRIREVLKR